MGPLYHLRGVGVAAAALVPLPKEHGALIPGDILVAKSTSRLVKLLNGIRLGFIDDGEFAAIICHDRGQRHGVLSLPGRTHR